MVLSLRYEHFNVNFNGFNFHSLPHSTNHFRALAASTLVCDAVLHLIPEALGIEYPSAQHSLVYVSETLKKQIMVLVAVYAMYL